MSMSAVLKELREIKDQLKEEPTYIDRFTLSKATAVTSFDDTLKVDGQGFNLYVISTDGNLADISYQIKNVGGEKVDEMEAEQFAYIPGPVERIDFKNDTAEAGKSIFVTAYKISRLAPSMPPPSPPGTGSPSDVVDPEVLLAGLAKLPYSISKATNPVFVTANVAITGTNTFMTFESPVGTDYDVPASKKLIIYKVIYQGAVLVTYLTLGYGDDGKADGTVEAANFVRIIGSGNSGSPLVNGGSGGPTGGTADAKFSEEILVEVPAGKFPAANKNNTNGIFSATIFGVEVDA